LNQIKHIAVLLDGPIKNDYRVIKMITSLSIKNKVDLFYIDGNNSDDSIFSKNVRLFSFENKIYLWKKVVRNTFFYLEFAFFGEKILATKIKYDYVYANDLPTLYPALKTAQSLGAKLIYDSHEIYIETINQFFPKNTSTIKKLIYGICMAIMKYFGTRAEKNMVKETDCMITVNNSLKDYFNKRYQPKRIEVIMNFPHGIREKKAPINYREMFNWDQNDLIFIYQGVLNDGRGLNYMMEVMKHVSPRCKLVVVGDGFIKEELKSFVDENQLKNKVKFIDKVSLKVLNQYTSGADIGVNLLEGINLSKRLASPNKLFEYIHAEIPILCSDSIENMNVLSKFEVGLATKNSVEDITNTMNQFLEQDNSSYRLNCIKAAKEYVWENQQNIIEKIVDSTTISG
jgi:hypothetical protein